MDNLTPVENKEAQDIETIVPLESDIVEKPIESEEATQTYKKGDVIKTTGVGILLTITGFIGGQLQATPSEKITVEDSEKPREELSVKIDTPTVNTQSYTLTSLQAQHDRIQNILDQYESTKTNLLSAEVVDEHQIGRIDSLIETYKVTLSDIDDQITKVDSYLPKE